MRLCIIQNKQFNDLNPVQFGQEQCPPGQSYGPCIRSFHLLHFVVSGKGKLYCDNTVYPVKAGQFFVIRPNEMTTYTADKKEPWKYIWIGFTGSMIDNYDFLNNRVVDYNGKAFYEMTDVENHENSREEFLLSKLLLLFSEFPSKDISSNSYVKATKNFIKSNYMNNISLSEIARNIGIDRTYLSKLFKAQTNTTFRDYLNSVRLNKATELLQSGYNVSETALMCGYKDYCTFSRAYKKHFQITPLDIKTGYYSIDAEEKNGQL